jgi:hypothetical protein
MLSNEQAYTRALVSGSLAAAAAAATAAWLGRRQTGSYAAPLNATSHVVWGEEATWRNRATLKYTGTGLLLTHGSGVFWAILYEKLFGRGKWQTTRPAAALAGAGAISLLAYLVDYHLVPRRLTPGYERRVSDRGLAAIFAALAAGMAARDLWELARRA